MANINFTETEDGVTLIELDGDAGWQEFVAENRDAIEDEYGSVENALVFCREKRLVFGGGATPLFEVFFKQ